MRTDAELLKEYSANRDADAFAELVRRHAGMVYGTSLRITGNADDAEDVAQECFLTLARKAATIGPSPAGWLHSTATGHALGAIRDATTRRRHEEQAMSDKPDNEAEPTWEDISPGVDEALKALSDGLRVPLVMHYLEGRTQADISSELGVDQSTVSRRLEKGVDELREKLREAGVVVSAALLATLLMDNAASAALPATLTAALGKMALAGVGKAGTAVAASSATGAKAAAMTAAGAAVKIKIAVAVAAGVIAVGGVIAYKVATEQGGKPSQAPAASDRRGLTPTPKLVGLRREPAVSKRIDYSKLVLKGDHWRDDSFSLVMHAVARMFGREADYETVFALSTNGFTPSIAPGCDCRASWRKEAGHERCIGTVASFLGFEARKLVLPEAPPLPKPDEGGRTWGTPAYNEWLDNRKKACAPVVRDGLDGGAVVVADGGWLHHYYLWGVVREAHADGRIVGTAIDGPRDNVMDHIRNYWAITPAGAKRSQVEADLAMLRQAVARIRGDRAPFIHGEVLFGLPAMDRWIEQMRRPAFQEDDPPSSAGNARINALISTHGAEVVSAYLRRRLESFPEAARPHLEAVAGRYDRVAGLLRPFAVWEDGKGYRALMGKTGNIDKQKAHSEEVLVPVKAELTAAADDIEKALAAIGPPKPDYSKVILKGNGHTQDSFSLTVQAAAKLLGVEADYETIYALSTNAFAPAIDKGEDCMAWWHVQGWLGDEGMETVAGRLGLRARRLDLPPDNLSPADPEDVFERKALEHRKRCAAILHREMDDGAVVVTSGGWKVRTDQGFAPWCWWGVVTKAEADGTLAGACLKATPGRAEGYRDRPLDYLGDTWVLRASEHALTAHQADLRMVRTAVRRIRAAVEPFKQTRRSAFGLDAMDVWIEQMRTVRGFCASCTERAGNGWTDALNNGQTTSAGTKVAAAYLRTIAGAVPEAARPRLNAAASHYDRVVELLRPVDYKQFIGDLAKQKAHAESVLVPVKRELAAAADEMERALVATLGAGLTDEQKERLKQWGNIFGREKMVEVANDDPAFYELLKLEISLQPVSKAVRRLRGAMGRIEPAEFTYAAQLDAVFGALGSGDVPDDILLRGGFSWDSPLWDAQKARRAELAGELRQWIDGGAGELAGVLGERNDDKLRLARLVLHEFETNGPDRDAVEALRADAVLGDFAHRIEMLDGELWSHDRNFGLLMRSIAELRPIGTWHTPGGPLAWGDAAPDDKPKVERMLARLDAWLAGGGDAVLGDKAAYPEKVWLARCLATYLRYHLGSSWDWMEKGATVKRDGDRVMIPGLETAKWGGFSDRQNTVVAAMTEAMRVMGEDVTFEYLMGVSGAAFRLHVAQPEWHPSAPHATCGFDCSAPAAGAFGYTIARHEVKEGDAEAAGRRTRAIVKSINDGRPALFDGIACSVITGHIDDGKEILLRRSGAKNDGYTPFSKWTWEGAGILHKLGRKPGRRDSIIESLRIAVKVAKTEKFNQYASGFAAYEKWVEQLDDESSFENLPGKDHKYRCFVNGWMYMSLAGDRKMAAVYVRKVAGEFEGEAARHLGKAADLYSQIEKALFSERDGFPNPYYLYPQDLDDATGWTKRLRKTQAAILRDALALERQAVAEIEKALAVIQAEAMKAKVKREGNRVWIEGVPAERRVEGIWHMDGLPASLRSALEHKGAEAKYLDDTTFAAITGQPFRFWFSDDFASCLAYTHEEPVGVIVAGVLGYEYTWCDHGAVTRSGKHLGNAPRDRVDRAEKAWQRMREELDAGNPVVMFGGETPPDEKASPVVVTGYDAARNAVYFLPHIDWRPAPQWSEDDPECRDGIRDQGYRSRRRPDHTNWRGNGFAPDHGMGGAGVCFFAFRSRQRVPTEHEVAVAVLERAVGLGRGRLSDEKRAYRKSGLVAFDALIASLGRDEIHFFGRTRPWSEVEDWWFAMECLTAGGFRKAASAFVRKCAGGFGGFAEEERKHLAAAAEAYDESGEHMAEFIELFAAAGPLDEYEDRMRTAGEALSSREFRTKAADIVRSIHTAEAKAIAQIEKALAAARVERDGDRLVLRDFPTGTDYQVRGFGMLLALRDCLAFEGVDVDWNDLLGYSGDAFGCDSMHYDSVRAHDVLMEGARAYGFEAEWSFGHEEPPFATLDRTLAEGRPAMVGGAFFGSGCLYFPVVIGEDRVEGRFLVAGIGEKPKWVPAPAEDGVVGRWNGQCPWATGAKRRGGIAANWQGSPRFVLKGRVGHLAERERLTNALRLGVASYRAAPLEMHWGGERWTCALGRGYLVKWPDELHKWAKRLRERGPVDPNDGDPPRPGYFNPTAMSVRRRAAAAFLRKHARALPEAAHPHLEAAAASYEKSVEAAERMFDALYAVDELRNLDALSRLRVRLYIAEGKGAAEAVARYAKENPNLFAARAALIRRMTETFAAAAAVEEACRLADEILRSDDAAIAEIEKALAARAAQEGGGEVLIEGAVELFRNGKAWNRVPDTVEGPGPHSYLLMHFLQMRTAGWDDVDLDDVAVLSGASALYAYQHGAFEPKYAYRRNKPDERIAEATGFGYEWKSFADTEGAWQFVKESIASGRPVKGEYGENILFAGYEAAAKPEDRKVFAISDEPDTFAKWWTWAEFAKWAETVTGWGFPNLGRHAEKVPASDPKATALRVMENLVAWSSEPPEACRKAHPKATFGLAGIEKYAADCADMDKFPDFGMCHDMNCQWAVRKSTSAYLRRLGGTALFSPRANEHILAAAAKYQAAFDAWVVAFKNIGWAAPKGSGKVKERRVAAAEAVGQAREHEGRAVEELGRALMRANEDAKP